LGFIVDITISSILIKLNLLLMLIYIYHLQEHSQWKLENSLILLFAY